jgi:hypothetical protein
MAELVQLKAGPPKTSKLEPGHWYSVQSRLYTGLLQVIGPDAVVTPIHESLVRTIGHEPALITRVKKLSDRARRPSKKLALLEFHGICPRGHTIDKLNLAQSRAVCPECALEYGVENETHSSDAS